MMPLRPRALFLAGAASVCVAAMVLAQRQDAYVSSRDHPAIQYTKGPVDTSVTRLNRHLEAGRIQLTFEEGSGYLRSLLAQLGVPLESQQLVFSQGSAQAPLIKVDNPRAIYFNDTTAIGWVRGAETVELAAHDPQQGTIFYTLDQKKAGRPVLKRDDSCLQCHLTWDTLGVPGLTVLSTFPMSDDKHAYASGLTVDHRVDLNMRWGGWYVTGKSLPTRHMGNLPVVRPAAELAKPEPLPPPLQSVAGRFDPAGFPSLYSDVVAAMVLGHQTHMTNHLTRLGWEARVAEPQIAAGAKPAVDRLQVAVRDFVDYLLFVDEALLPKKLEGSSGFAEHFVTLGPVDRQGRSLRQFDLDRRLLRYPCSYMIYSPAFDALPAVALDAVYRRMWTILSGEETAKPYSRLSLADRTAIVEILRDTKKNLPSYFQAVVR